MRLDPLGTKHPIGVGVAVVVVCTAIMAVLPSWFSGFAGPFANRLVQALATGAVLGVLMWRLVRFRQGRGRSVDFLLFDPVGFL
jgi:hypothetical protein